MGEIQWIGLAGLWGGALIGFLGWWLGRRMAAKKRGLDERYLQIWKNARGGSWMLTLGALYVLFTLQIIGVTLSAYTTLGILFIVHLAGWAVLGVYNQFKL
ncbi:hypothetical protein IM538_09005 [Cytobacillus suaedae]|nr:hypothetical protein IM538_09005 [Cytobacillus suaedae]